MTQPDTYLTIADVVSEGSYSEKRSRFLAFAHHVETAAEVKTIVDQYKRKYYDARHVCYAYMLGVSRETFRTVDDGEPSSTAGKPILGQINSRSLTDVLVVVVRYYGGINLGTSRLIVAYREAAAAALDNATTQQREITTMLSVAFPYEKTDAVNRVIHDLQPTIISQQYDLQPTIVLSIRQSMAQQLADRLEKIPSVTVTFQ